MVVVRRRQSAGARDELRHGQPRFLAGLLNCLGFGPIAVRPVEQHAQQRPERFRKYAGHKFRTPGVDLYLLLALALLARQRRLSVSGGAALKRPLPLR